MSAGDQKETVVIKAVPRGVDCPYCDCYHDDFLIDPRGHDIKCEECGKEFHIHDTEVDLS